MRVPPLPAGNDFHRPAMRLDDAADDRETQPRAFGTGPNPLEPVVPWPRTLTPEQLRTVTALCDMIIPHDDKSPSASAVGVPDFLDEWVSAPYPEQQADRKQILEGLAWLNVESKKPVQKGICRASRNRETTDLR